MLPIRLLAAACTLAVLAPAQFTVVAPVGHDNLEGNSNNIFPFGRNAASMHYLQIQDSSNFTTQNINFPIVISNLRFRVDNALGAATWAGGSWPNVVIELSTAAVDHSAISTTFASNHGPDRAIVHSGAVTVQPGTRPGSSTVPGPWHVSIPITPFVYDPSSGNDLVLDVQLDGTGWTGAATQCDAVSGAAALGARIWDSASSNGPTANGSALDYCLVCEYTYVPAAGLYASFSSNVTGGGSPLNVNFTDTSFSSAPGGVTGWAWDLDGDTLIDSTLQNPTFVYNNCGSYNVSLTVTDAQHSPSTVTRTAYITTDNVTPSFTFATIVPGVIQFTDTSTPTPTSWAWDLDGDNLVDSTVQNPVFVYPGSCTAVTVTLTVNRLCRGPFSTSQGLVLSPASMATVMTGGNGLSAVGSGNTFDIQVTNPDGIRICAISMAPYMATPVLGAPLGCTIWVTDAPGGYLANHTNAAVWRQVATGTGTFAGGTFSAPVPVAMTLSQPLYLPQGTFGMAVHMTTGSGVAYTTLTAQTTYNGPDFNIIAGNGKGAPFSTTANNPRGFNGIFHYSTIANGQTAGYGFMGAGCAGTMPIANLAHSGPPAIGTTLSVVTNNLPVSQMVMLTGFSNTTSLFGPLPFDGAPFGAPGCRLLVSTEAVLFLAGAGNQAVWNFNIANDAVFIGQKFYNQALVVDPLANPLGAVASDAAAFVIGL